MSSLKITGKTFEHRETIKRLGGKFDGVSKSWTLADTEANRAAIAALAGVSISEASEEYKPTEPVKPTEQNFRRAFGAPIPTATAAAPVKMPQAIMGNSEQHIRTFGPATNFGGFDSLTSFVEFVENVPDYIKNDRSRGSAYDSSAARDTFTGTSSMREAINLTRNGWAEGVRMAEKVAERIVGQMPTRRARVHSVAGGSVNVGRMLSGNPLHMRQRVKQPAHKVVTLVHQFTAASSVNSGDMEIRAAVVAAIADTLEDNGYSCEILAASNNEYRVDRNAIDVIRIKSAGDRLNLSDVMFGLGHPSFLRRLAFARWACIEPFPYTTMGHVNTVSTDAPNTFVIGHLPHKFSTKDLSFDAKVAAIVKQIVPENLPLEFKFNA